MKLILNAQEEQKKEQKKRLAKKDEKTNINRAEVALTKAVNRIKVYEHH